MTKFNEWLYAHPEARAGLRVAVYTFLSGFILSLMGFLTDVAAWAASTDAVFPSVAPLGKAFAAAVVAALSGLIGYVWNKLPRTPTATYVPAPLKEHDDRGELTISMGDIMAIGLALIVLVVAITMLT